MIKSRSRDTTWRQMNIHLPHRHAGELMAISVLGPTMHTVETAGIACPWFYIRKGDVWRLRFRRADDPRPEQPTTIIRDRLTAAQNEGQISHWVTAIYEPETYAFGGPQAMDTAHNLFHHDSRHTLAHLRRANTAPLHGPADKGKELSVLLCTALMRAAGQDWYEQGDIWSRVAEHRPLGMSLPPEQAHRLVPAMRRLMAVDTGAGSRLINGPLRHTADWMAGFEQAGRTLADLAAHGNLTRGLRAVLAHHVLFHWNRLGLPTTAQAILAATARDAVMNPPDTTPGTELDVAATH